MQPSTKHTGNSNTFRKIMRERSTSPRTVCIGPNLAVPAKNQLEKLAALITDESAVKQLQRAAADVPGRLQLDSHVRLAPIDRLVPYGHCGPPSDS